MCVMEPVSQRKMIISYVWHLSGLFKSLNACVITDNQPYSQIDQSKPNFQRLNLEVLSNSEFKT